MATPALHSFIGIHKATHFLRFVQAFREIEQQALRASREEAPILRRIAWICLAFAAMCGSASGQTIAKVSPSTVLVGSPDTNVTITGTGFVTVTPIFVCRMGAVLGNVPGTPDATGATLKLPKQSFMGTGTIQISTDPMCAIANQTADIIVTATSIKALNPSSVLAGSPDTNITITGNAYPTDAETSVYVCDVKGKGTEIGELTAPQLPRFDSYPRDAKGTITGAIVKIQKELLASAGTIKISTDPACAGSNTQAITINTIKQVAPAEELLLGVNVSAASSASPQAVVLGLAILDLPIADLRTMDLSQRRSNLFWISGYLGLSGMAQPGSLTAAASSGFYAGAANATPDKIVQSMDGVVHFGYQFLGRQIGVGTFDSGTTAVPDPKTLVTLSVIAGFGALTPLSSTQAAPPVYEATPLILSRFTPYSPTTSFASSCTPSPITATPSCFVAFIPDERTRFYRHYEGGIRLRIYGEDSAEKKLRFPGIVEATFGQNEYVTGGSMQGAVFHVLGVFPFPVLDGVYTFGTMDLAISRNNNGTQFLLIPAPATAGVTYTSPSVYLISTTQPNRDRYTIGFGVDIFHLFSKYFSKKPPSDGAPSSQ